MLFDSDIWQLRLSLEIIIIDHKAREIMHLVASVRLSVCPSVRLFALSRLNRLTYDLHLLHGGRP